MSSNPQIDPIYKKGTNKAAVLLIHGFTATPDAMRPLANDLHEEGFTVFAPLLAGHGTTPEQLKETSWRDWYNSTQIAFKELQKKYKKIFVGGLSLGALLSLKLALENPEEIRAICCMATPLSLGRLARTAIPIIENTPLQLLWKYQKKYDIDMKDQSMKKAYWNYNRMPLSCVHSLMELQSHIKKRLSEIKHPLIAFHSRHDKTAPYHSMFDLAEAVSSEVCETITLENSYHILTLDFDRHLMARKISQFYKRFL